MKSILQSPRTNSLKTIVRVRVAQVFRVLREHYPDEGLMLAACLSLTRRRRTKNVFQSGDQPQSILVIRLDAMGDVVMSTPIFRALKQAYPEASITALVPKANLELLETSPFIDQVLTLVPVRRPTLLQRAQRDVSIVRLYWTSLREKHFDLVLQPRLGPDYFGANLLLTLVNASFRMKYKDDLKSSLSKYLARVAYRSVTELPRPSLQHEVLSNTAFVRRFTGKVVDGCPEIFLSRLDRSFARNLWHGFGSGSTIVCVAFGAQAKRRRWPLEHWVETLCLLAKSLNISVVILCSRAEKCHGERLRSMLDFIPGINSWIVSGASLRQVASCIKACELLLGADSGLAHLAAAVGCAVLVVSPHPVNGDPHHENSPLRFKPYSDRASVLQPETSRYPCRSGCDAVEPHCILNVTPRQVAQVAEKMLLASRHAFRLASQSRKPNQGDYLSSSRSHMPHIQASMKNELAVNSPAVLQQKQANE